MHGHSAWFMIEVAYNAKDIPYQIEIYLIDQFVTASLFTVPVSTKQGAILCGFIPL